jgi:hypothetical protein
MTQLRVSIFRRLAAFAYATLACSMALAQSALPPSTPLLELPKGTKILLQREISDWKKAERVNRYDHSISEHSTFVMLREPARLPAGKVVMIVSVKDNPDYPNLFFDLDGPFGVNVLDGDYKKVRTVGDFQKMFAGVLQLTYEDPVDTQLRGMPDDMRQDFLMTRILSAIKADRHGDAIADFVRMEKLDGPKPESFYYYFIVSLDKAGQPKAAKERAMEFLKTYGKKSKYYNDVMQIVAK